MNDYPQSVVVEILRGWLDAYDHGGKRLDALLEVSRTRSLQAIIEAVELIGVGKAMADSKKVIQEALELIAS